MRRTGYILLIVLSLGVSAYAAVAYGLAPLGAAVHPDMRATYEAHRLAIYTHIAAALIALAIGPFQFSVRLRMARVHLHRWLGRIYLIGILIGGLAGLYIAFYAFGGLPARIGFACLALSWLYTGFRAYRAIRSRDILSHRRWMVRNFSLTFAAVTLRIWLPLSMVSGIPFEVAYPVIAWLSWVPNLLAAEWLLRQTQIPSIGKLSDQPA
jgi:uncharacterized membrane protein